MINELTRLNISIKFNDPSNQLSGSILLDTEDWTNIIAGLTSAGYRIVKEATMEETKDIVLEVQDGYIDVSMLFNHIDEGLQIKEVNNDGKGGE